MKQEILQQLDFCIDRLISLSFDPRIKKLSDAENDLGDIAVRLSSLREGVSDEY